MRKLLAIVGLLVLLAGAGAAGIYVRAQSRGKEGVRALSADIEAALKDTGSRPTHAAEAKPFSFEEKAREPLERAAKGPLSAADVDAVLQATHARAVRPFGMKLPSGFRVANLMDPALALAHDKLKIGDAAAIDVCVDLVALGRDFARVGAQVELQLGLVIIRKTIAGCEFAWTLSSQKQRAADALTAVRSAIPKMRESLRQESTLMQVMAYGSLLDDGLKKRLPPALSVDTEINWTTADRVLLLDTWPLFVAHDRACEAAVDLPVAERDRAIAEAQRALTGTWNPITKIAANEPRKYDDRYREILSELDGLIGRLRADLPAR